MAVWSEVDFAKVGRTTRFDAEFYRPEYLQYETLVESGQPLLSCATISHPTEIKRIYEDSGIQILLAQNVRPNRLDFSTAVYMPLSVKAILLTDFDKKSQLAFSCV